MTDEQEIDMFKMRLAETIAWCAAQARVTDPANSLRTAALTPSNRRMDFAGYADFDWETEESGDQVLSALAEPRAGLLKIADLTPAPLPASLVAGRLIVYQPDQTLEDGLSEEISKGFFDQGDVPPWDTWVWISEGPPGMSPNSQPYRNSYLICWVPSMFINLAADGIAANCVNCISWASCPEASHPFVRKIQSTGLFVSSLYNPGCYPFCPKN